MSVNRSLDAIVGQAGDTPLHAAVHVSRFPDNPRAAESMWPWYQQRAKDAFGRLQQAQREHAQAVGELAILRDVINGEFQREAV